MKTNEFIEKILKEKLGDYATANKISKTLGLSLVFIYAIARNEKIVSRKKYGRTEYLVEDFIKYLSLGKNINIIGTPLSKDEFFSNNFCEWQSKNELESFLENLLLDELGEFSSIAKLVEFFKVSKNVWQNALDEGKIIYFNVAKRKVIVTRSLLPYLREGIDKNLRA